jgi:ketosteroid isomerase-like protein
LKPVKRIFSLALVAAALATAQLACKKTGESGILPGSDNQQAQSAGTPENKDKLLADLTTALKDYFSAFDRGDKAALERLLSADFSTRWRGKDYDKDDWITPQTGQPNVAKDEIFNTELEGSSADTATMHFERRQTYKDNSAPYKERDSASFVKRDGRWQIKTFIYGH